MESSYWIKMNTIRAKILTHWAGQDVVIARKCNWKLHGRPRASVADSKQDAHGKVEEPQELEELINAPQKSRSRAEKSVKTGSILPMMAPGCRGHNAQHRLNDADGGVGGDFAKHRIEAWQRIQSITLAEPMVAREASGHVPANVTFVRLMVPVQKIVYFWL